MRILVVTTWFPSPGHPAVGAFVARDVAALAARHDVRVLHLASPGFAQGSDDDGPQVLDFPGMDPVRVRVRRLVTDLRRPDHLARAGRTVVAAARGADVLHTAVFSTLLPLAGRRVPVPWVHTEHWHGVTSTAGDSLGLRLVTPPLRALLRRPDVVTAVSEVATAPVRELRGARPTLVVPCVVAPPAQVPPRRALDGGSAPGGDSRVAEEMLRLVAVGGLVPGKRPLLAVETLAALRARGVAAELTWVGDGPLRAEVEARATALGVTIHLPGALDAVGVSAELADADLFLLPTRRETFGVAIAEALAHGRPVVTGAEGGFREFADDGVSAFVDSSEPESWAAAVLDVLDRTRDRSAAQIAATLGDRFTSARVREGYERAYALADAQPERPKASGAAAGAGRGGRDGSHGAGPLDATTSQPPPSSDLVSPPRVDVVIAVHTETRPVDRAVRSVLANAAPVRVTVVCHHVPAERIAARLGALPEEARALGHEVRLVEHEDGVASPAGPFNKGLDLASAEHVALLGSDDRLAAGAIDSWLALADETHADAVIARLAYARPDGTVRAVVPTPPARPWRVRNLDPVRDRLAYRSAPLGLLRRETLERLGLRHAEGQPVGEDLVISTRLWFEGERIAFDRTGPAYLIGEDGADRITFAPRPLAQDLLWLPDLLEARWFRVMPLVHRRALAVKILRIHLFGAIHYRSEPDAWTADERATLRELTLSVLTAAPDVERVLSRAEHDLLDAALSSTASAERLIDLSARRRRHGTPATLVPRDPRYVLAREAPLRFMAASALSRW
ncbi:MAG: glycosyltransferase [Actinomycetales bacterium]|nr:glycosyltransferase [Actinomycetales bacterium]